MAQRLLESMKTILDVVSMDCAPEITDNIYTLIGKIDVIHTDDGWFYATCSQCSKLLDTSHGFFWCDICNGLVRYPMIRFRVHLHVQDATGATILTLYNQDVEWLLDTSANKLFNRLGMGNNNYPLELFRLTGRTFMFHIRMPDYHNPDHDFHNYRIVSLSEIDPIPQVPWHATPANRVGKKEVAGPFGVVVKEEGPGTDPKPPEPQESAIVADAFSDTGTPLEKK